MSQNPIPRILAAIRSSVWAVQPATLQAIRDTVSDRMHGKGQLAAMPIFSDGQGEDMPVVPGYTMVRPGVACVRVDGILGKRLSSLETMCGGVDVDTIGNNLSAAVSDPVVKCVVLAFDSPGGVVTGVPELAAQISVLSEQKGIFAFTDTLCCSGAYWLASACEGIICTPTANLGSIGVYMALVDESENWAAEGYTLKLVKAGDWKAAGIAGSKITDEQMAIWQKGVDDIYVMFTDAVRDGRMNVTDATMQGQVFMGQAAMDAKLVDAIGPGFDWLCDQLAGM